MNISFYRDCFDKHGWEATAFHALYQAANRVVRLAIWNAVAITPETVRRSRRSDGSGPVAIMLGAESLRGYVAQSGSMLTHDFLDQAAAKGDRCFAFFDGDTLTSYGWYSKQPTRLVEVPGDLVLHFAPAWVYMYNGYTRPEYRGQRLHAIGMTAALEQYAREGKRGLVSYVDASNAASLKSCTRMGYRTFGRVVVIGRGERFLHRTSAGCAAYGFRLESERPGGSRARLTVEGLEARVA
jgi:hypothetical protein